MVVPPNPLANPTAARPLLSSDPPAVAPLVTAGLLLAAISELARLGLPHPTATAVVQATGVSRSRAYEVRAAIEAIAPTAIRPPGRPPSTHVEPDHSRRYDLAVRARDFAYAHPGAVVASRGRRTYTSDFRRFALDLTAEHKDVPLDALADAIGVPLPTLKDWLSAGAQALRPEQNLTTVQPPPDPTGPQIETILAVWKTWSGNFAPFCRHIQHDWRIPMGRTLIAEILTAYGVRFAKRRSGRSPDEDALRGQFVTFFPNAQWVADGSPISVVVDGQTCTFNVELMVDPYSGAVVGASVRDNEDAEAVVDAFVDAVATTGERPYSVLVDNKPSNHAKFVHDALGERTKVERATVARPQNKAHVDGAFGLFQQVVPSMILAIGAPRDVARQVLDLIVTTWARSLNHRPRKDRGGKSRIEEHSERKPTPDDIQRARDALAERIRKQDLARRTLAARQDPLVRALISEAFTRLGFADPDGHLLTGIARYPLDAVVEGIAIVEGKRRAGTLPPDVDARYLLGVIRNVSQDREGWEIALELWDARSRARDASLQAAERERHRVEEASDLVERRVAAYIDRALATSRRLDRFFWLQAVADAIEDGDPSERRPSSASQLGASTPPTKSSTATGSPRRASWPPDSCPSPPEPRGPRRARSSSPHRPARLARTVARPRRATGDHGHGGSRMLENNRCQGVRGPDGSRVDNRSYDAANRRTPRCSTDASPASPLTAPRGMLASMRATS